MDATKYEELCKNLGEIEENKRYYVKSLIKDFLICDENVRALETLPTFEVDKDNPKRQRKLPAHDMLKEWMQRKTELARAIMRELNGVGEEESALAKLLKQYE